MATYNVENLSVAVTPPDDSAGFQSVSTGTADSFTNDGATFLWVKTTGTATVITVLSVTSVTPAGFGPITPMPNYTFSMGASTKEYLLGPFAPARFNNANGLASVGFSVTTGVTAKAIRFVPIV